MIRIYLDWNVMAQMKGGHLDDLYAILNQKERFFVPYSSSHIGDLLTCQNETDELQKNRIKTDLDYISALTNDYCLFNTGNHIMIDRTDPHSLYEDRSQGDDILESLSEGVFEKLLSNDGFAELGQSLDQLLKSTPIDSEFNAALKNPETRDMVSQIFPDLAENPTLMGVIQSLVKMMKSLNENDGYQGLRELTRNGVGINRDKIFSIDKPFDLIEKKHMEFGFNWDKYTHSDKNAPKWFNDISNAYLKLDMHGFQEDKVEVKPNKRKQTFANTTEDGFHAAFASTCHFYITNDKKSCAKTKKVYEKLNINTIVLRPNEFVDYYNHFIGNTTEFISDNFQTIIEIINGREFEETEIENGIRRIFKTPKFIFDFFNGITRQWELMSGEQITMLFRNMPTNSSATFAYEVRNLVNRIDPEFCKDEKNLSTLSDETLKNENWSGIRWQMGDLELILLGYQNNIQMYIKIIDAEESSD